MPKTRSIVKKYRPLNVEEIPERILHRESQKNELGRCIEPLLEDAERKPQNVLLHGPAGSGKTSLARYTINELRKKMKLDELYVNCFAANTRIDILYELLDKKLTVPREGTSTGTVRQKLNEKIRKKDCIIIIDEVDQIRSEEILYDLSRFTETPIIMTANDPNTFAYFKDRIQSRMTDRTDIQMPKYTEEEITQILEERAERALKKNSYTREQLKLIAEKSEGNARTAINTLKNAAQSSETQIRKEILLDAVETASKKSPTKKLGSLNSDQKKLYEIMNEENRKMQIGEILEEYRDQTEDPKSRKTVQRYLRKMNHYNFIEKTGKKSNTTYSARKTPEK